MTTNIWGSKVEGGTAQGVLAEAVEDALAGHAPMYGGQLVEQVTTLGGRVYRVRDGWILEAVRPLCADGKVHFRRKDWMGRSFGVAMFGYIGAEQPDADEVAAALEADLKRNPTAANDQEIEVALDWALSDEDAVTAVYDVCTHCRTALGTRSTVYKYLDGSLSCKRCANVEQKAS